MVPIIDPFIPGLARIILDITTKVGGSFFEVIQDNIQAIQAAKNYVDKYKSRYGVLKLLGMSESVSLESVYTPVKFLDQLSISSFESIEELEKYYREGQKRCLQPRNRIGQDGMTVDLKNPLLMVLGSPGAGKSTLLRRVGLEAFKGSEGMFKHSCLPVFIELKRFNTEQVDLIDAIAKEFDIFGFPSSKKFATEALKEGKLLVLLDGLDEVPENNRNQVIDLIETLVTKYDKNRFIASCRIAAYRSSFKNFRDIELADFDDNQIKYFIDNWFQSEQYKRAETAIKCWKILNQPGNEATKELAQTPLLLTFLCLVYQRSQNFPNKRSTLYRKALNILLEEWAAEKLIHQEKIYQGLYTDLEIELLAEIAYQNFEANQLFFEKQELVEQIRDFLANIVDARPKKLDSASVLDAIAVQQGILVERAEDIYSFSHLTLQEFLTAHNIAINDIPLKDLVEKHLSDDRWREVFLLLAGLKPADNLLLAMEQQIQTYIKTELLQNLLAWAEQITNTSPPDIKPVGKRAIAIALILTLALAEGYPNPNAVPYPKIQTYAVINAYVKDYPNTNAYALTNAYIDFFSEPNSETYNKAYKEFNDYTTKIKELKVYKNIDFNNLLDKLKKLEEQISDKNKSEKTYRDFANNIIQTVLKSFQLTTEMINFSKEEFRSLENYFYANKLMIDCKEAAVRVSQKTWDGIEERMFTNRGS